MEFPTKEVTVQVLKGKADDYVRAVRDSGLGFYYTNYDIFPDGRFDYVVFYIPDWSNLSPVFPRRLEIKKANLEELAKEFLPHKEASASGQSF